MVTRKELEERGLAENFLMALTEKTGTAWTTEEHQDAPDFVFRDTASRNTMSVEVATVDYGPAPARALRAPPGSYLTVVSPEASLRKRTERVLLHKWRKDYGPRCVLALHADAPLHSATELDGVFAEVEIPNGTSPFEGVFVRARADITEPYELVWWSLYPHKGRWFEQLRLTGGGAGGGAP